MKRTLQGSHAGVSDQITNLIKILFTKSFFLEIQVHLHDSTELIRLHSHLGVGKTSILEKVKQNKFSEEHYTTIGVDFNSLVVEIFSDTKVKLQVWDTVTQLSLNKC